MEASHRAQQEVNNAKKEIGIFKLTVHNHNQNLAAETLNDITNKPAVVCGKQCQIKPDSSTHFGEKIEVIKVYLERGRQEQDKEQPSVTMLTDEVSQIQEVRYCLKTLREQMAARQHNSNNKSPANGIRVNIPTNKSPVSNASVDALVPESQEEECVRLREMTKHLYAQLQEVEKRHQEEKEALKAENREYLRHLEEQNEHLQQAQKQAEGQGKRIEELQTLLGNLKLENASLHDQMAAGEAELQELRALKNGEDGKRCKQLEIEQAVLKQKIHQLDDMLKSQQRKVRHMIEQLQNSRTMMEERERLIGDLEERVAFLEAENREMRDQIEFCPDEQTLNSFQSEKEAQIVYSKPLIPTSPGNKPLPFIKVIEIKS
ncbi:tuftelin 1b isoform X2 [Silurus meridionalis]|uniref:tuftelin 1b isoform X2 n=1 Tax=Silurus meridionalis TaxID=175797 RepID=UPI001EEB0258|nr:tuftelin 1b isoform X2 [Silurus meridionalis]